MCGKQLFIVRAFRPGFRINTAFHLQELEELKGVVSRQVGLVVVKADTSITMSYTRVSALTPLTTTNEVITPLTPLNAKAVPYKKKTVKFFELLHRFSLFYFDFFLHVNLFSLRIIEDIFQKC